MSLTVSLPAATRQHTPCLTFVTVVLTVFSYAATDAHAACNLFPVAAASFASTQGGVVSPIAAPGQTVELRLSGCDPSAGFERAATDNQVTITFEPPGGGSTTDVVVNSGLILSTDSCTMPNGHCRVLRFTMPDTTGITLPDLTVATNGLAGPARIKVRDLTSTVVAEIADLNLPALSCDKTPETVFKKFTVLPKPNNFRNVQNGTTTQVLATVDGGNNLLVPFDYWGNGTTTSVLVDRPGTPEARYLTGNLPIQAFVPGPTTTILQAVAAQSNPSRLIRAFTLNGRPLPPLLRVREDGSGVYGTADATASVLRVAAKDGLTTLYDVTNRLTDSGRGPIVIGTPTVTVQASLPLRSLRSSSETAAFARDEVRENANINPDGDKVDLVAQIVNGVNGAVTNTQEAVSEIENDFFVAPAIVAAGDTVAYLLSEFGQGQTPENGDGDALDSIIRAFRRDGTDLAPAVFADASASRSISGAPLVVSGDKVFFRSPSDLLDYDAWAPNGAFGVAISPDGLDVYSTSPSDGAIAHLTRNTITGTLALTGAHGVVGTGGATGVVVSPDGANVYVAASTDHTINVYDRNTDPNATTEVQQVVAVNPTVPIFGATGLAMSSNSQFLYVASNVSDSLTVFERTGLQGELTFTETEVNGFGGVSGLDSPENVALSPDGKNVYVASSNSDSVAVFSRNALTGTVAFLEAKFDGVAGVDGLDGATAIAVSPDGRHVYVTGAFDRAVAIFVRNPLTGALTYAGAHFDAENAETTLNGTAGIAVSPDGQHVYVTARLASTVVTFRRNAETGALVLEDTLRDVDHFPLPIGVAVDATGDHVYVADNQLGGNGGSIDTIAMRHQLSVLDTATGTVLATRPPISRAAVAGQIAAFLRPESAGDLINRNSDADSADDIVQIYDATAPGGAVTNLGSAGNSFAANRVALSDTLVAFTVPEANQGNASLNADPESNDDVLFVHEIGEPPSSYTNVDAAADSIAVVGNKVVFITPEANEPPSGPGCGATVPPGGCDLNGDGDANDRVLRVYDYNPLTNSGTIIPIGQPAEEFITSGSLVAFRTSEAAAETNLNGGSGDTDQNDFVMQVYDLDSNTLLPTHRSAIPCFLPGCDPTSPYKASDQPGNRTVSYLTDEQDEGRDLDLDGDAQDIVLSIYNVRLGTTDTIIKVVDNTTPPANQPKLPPFPETPFDGTLITTEVRESDIGEDVNLDGDLNDIVVLVKGDSDNDGDVDDVDVCREVDTTDAADLDADGLGDTNCDPIAPPACPPTPRNTCRQTGTGNASFQAKDRDGVTKDSFGFSWSKGDATDLSAFADPATTLTSYYTLCMYDSSPQPQPLSHAVVFPGGRACGKKNCWTSLGTKGFKFKDTTGTPLGITDVTLTPGLAGGGKVQVKGKGKGGHLRVPALPLTGPVTVQLVVDNGMNEECWTATFSNPQKADTTQWKAKSD